MKYFLSVCAILLAFTVTSQEKEPSFTSLKTYVVGIAVKGKSMGIDSLQRAKYLEGHVAFIKDLEGSGDLVASGTLTTDPAFRGLYVFNVETIEEAQELIRKDAAIRDGYINLELHVWESRNSEGIAGSARPWKVTALILFALLCLWFVYRTFRGKAEA